MNNLSLSEGRHNAGRPVLVDHRPVGVSSVEPGHDAEEDGDGEIQEDNDDDQGDQVPAEWTWKLAKVKSKTQKWKGRKGPAGDPHAGLKAGPGEVDHGAAQHVPVLRGKHQRQVRPDQVPE